MILENGHPKNGGRLKAGTQVIMGQERWMAYAVEAGTPVHTAATASPSDKVTRERKECVNHHRAEVKAAQSSRWVTS